MIPARFATRAILFLFCARCILATPSICDALSANLVMNCGFETGSFSGWQTIPASSFASRFGVDADPNSGSFAAFFSGSGFDTIQQALPTAPGQFYAVSFWLAAPTCCSVGHDFQAYWDGVLVYQNDTFPIVTSYAEHSFTELANGSDLLVFKGLDIAGAERLDDVSVIAVPEPSSVGLLSGLFATVGLVIKVHYRSVCHRLSGARRNLRP